MILEIKKKVIHDPVFTTDVKLMTSDQIITDVKDPVSLLMGRLSFRACPVCAAHADITLSCPLNTDMNDLVPIGLAPKILTIILTAILTIVIIITVIGIMKLIYMSEPVQEQGVDR